MNLEILLMNIIKKKLAVFIPYEDNFSQPNAEISLKNLQHIKKKLAVNWYHPIYTSLIFVYLLDKDKL